MSFVGAVKLTGESAYRKALQNLMHSLKEVLAQMKLTSVTYSSNNTSMKASSAKSANLKNKLALQKDKVAELKKQYEVMSQQYQTNTSRHSDLLQKYADKKSKLEIIGKTLGTTSELYKAQKEEVTNLASQEKKQHKQLERERQIYEQYWC